MTHKSSWRRSSRSGGGTSDNCVEVRLDGRTSQLSDSKFVDNRPVVDVDRADYLAFIATLKASI